MQDIEFRKTVVDASFLGPSSPERQVHAIEHRYDPLTEVPCRINLRRADRLPPPRPAGDDLHELLSDSAGCPFCPDNLDAMTPRFLGDLVPAQRIRRGGVYLFPNLYPLGVYHAIGTFGPWHYLDLEGFTVQMLVEGFEAMQDYLAAVQGQGTDALHPIFIWNHLPPSAGSMVHPHFQVLVDQRTTPYQQRLLDTGAAYQKRTGRNYWLDLVRVEQEVGERFIGEEGSVAAVASFAPQGNREVLLVARDSGNLFEMTESVLRDLAGCLVRLLRAYGKLGVNSFNFSTFSAPVGQQMDYYCLHAKLISRPVFRAFYRNDTGILERFHYEADIEASPEIVAENLRGYF